MINFEDIQRFVDQVRIEVPSSSANVGLGYDIWCLGLSQPRLTVTYTQSQEKGIEVEVKSPIRSSRSLGHAGKVAVEQMLKELKVEGGGHLLFEDDGYQVGGLGRSGAEAAGAILAAAIGYDHRMSRDEAVISASRGEPGEHKDNVAGSINGRFNIISTSPASQTTSVDTYDVPENLGLAIGYSSFEKKHGTEVMRRVLQEPLTKDDFIVQSGLVSATTAALVSRNVDRFIELVWGDRFHEPRRARLGGYGKFSSGEFQELKESLYNKFHVATNVSGAGPSMLFLYNREDYRDGIEEAISPTVTSWFDSRGIKISVKATTIAREGAYDYAIRNYKF